MAFVFRDKTTKEILRIDFGEPDPEKYAIKEGLTNWEYEEIPDEDAKKLITPDTGAKMDWIARWKEAKTDDEKFEVLGEYLGWE